MLSLPGTFSVILRTFCIQKVRKITKMQNVGMQNLGFSVHIYKDMAMMTLVTWTNNFTNTDCCKVFVV
jgi:hypothetical protein